MAEKTRRAYGIDLGQFSAWCAARDAAPAAVSVRLLRRYAQELGEQRAAPATVARKLAAIRGCFGVLRAHGIVQANPAELVPAPKRGSKLPKVLRTDELARLLDAIPASTPLALRDRAMFELAYACGLRAAELVDLDVTVCAQRLHESLGLHCLTAKKAQRGSNDQNARGVLHLSGSSSRCSARRFPDISQVPDGPRRRFSLARTS